MGLVVSLVELQELKHTQTFLFALQRQLSVDIPELVFIGQNSFCSTNDEV